VSGDEEHDQLECGSGVQWQLFGEDPVLGVVGQGETVPGPRLREALHELAERPDEVVRLLRLRGCFAFRLDQQVAVRTDGVDGDARLMAPATFTA